MYVPFLLSIAPPKNELVAEGEFAIRFCESDLVYRILLCSNRAFSPINDPKIGENSVYSLTRRAFR